MINRLAIVMVFLAGFGLAGLMVGGINTAGGAINAAEAAGGQALGYVVFAIVTFAVPGLVVPTVLWRLFGVLLRRPWIGRGGHGGQSVQFAVVAGYLIGLAYFAASGQRIPALLGVGVAALVGIASVLSMILDLARSGPKNRHELAGSRRAWITRVTKLVASLVAGAVFVGLLILLAFVVFRTENSDRLNQQVFATLPHLPESVLVAEKSWSKDLSRVLRYSFDTANDAESVASFYGRELPAHGWRFTGSPFGDDVAIYEFRNGDVRLHVDLTPRVTMPPGMQTRFAILLIR